MVVDSASVAMDAKERLTGTLRTSLNGRSSLVFMNEPQRTQRKHHVCKGLDTRIISGS